MAWLLPVFSSHQRTSPGFLCVQVLLSYSKSRKPPGPTCHQFLSFIIISNVVPRPTVSISPTLYEKYKFLYILIYPGVWISECSVLTVLFSLIYISLQLAFIEYLLYAMHCAECYGEINKKKYRAPQPTPAAFKGLLSCFERWDIYMKKANDNTINIMRACLVKPNSL